MNSTCKTAFAAVALVCAVPASAATVTYRDNAVQSTLKQFDPALGTLESIFISNVYNNAFYLNFSGNPDAPVAPIVNVSGTIGNSLTGLVSIDQNVQSAFEGGGARVISVRISNSVQTFLTGDLSAYIGTGGLFFGPTPDVSFGGLTPAVVSFPTPSSQFSITYNFAAAVPEAATWIMMLTGFALTGYALRRRRARLAYV